MKERYYLIPWLWALSIALTGFSVSAQTCTTSATPIVFGNYSSFASAPTESTGNISVRCQANLALLISYSVSLTPGVSGSYAGRTLQSNANILRYQLHRDLTRTQVWGDGTGGSQPQPGSILLSLGSLNVANNHPVYGRVLARQNIPVGNYTDFIQIIVTY